MQPLSKYIILTGIIIVIIGVIVWLLDKNLTWFGSLPGDIKIVRKNFTFYMPIVTMLVLSIILSIIFMLIIKFFK